MLVPNPSKEECTVPKSPVPGMNTKIVGRVKPVENFKQPVEKTAVEKEAIEKTASEKTAYEKTSSEKVALNPIVKGGLTYAGKSLLGAAGALAGTYAMSSIINKVHNKIMEPKYKAALDKAIAANPRLMSVPRAKLDEYFSLVIEASPTMALNPLLIANVLDQLIDHEGRVNLPMFNTFLNTESQIIANKNNASPLMLTAQKAVIDGATKGLFDSYRGGKEETLIEMGREKGRKEGLNEGIATGFNRGHKAGMSSAFEAFSDNQ